MRRLSLPPLVLLLAVYACAEDDVGVPCQITTPDNTDVVSIALDAHDCRSRVCLLYGSPAPGEADAQGLCTASCDTDADCPDSMRICPNGFRCIHALANGSAACCKLCVCRDLMAGDDDALESHCLAHPNPRCPTGP